MKMYTTAAAGVLLAIAASSSLAQGELKPEKTWEVSAELGAIRTTGNTETESFNCKIDVVHRMENWKNQYIASALYKNDQVEQDDGTEQTETTAEKYFASAKSAYLLSDEFSNLFVYGSHTHDEFGAYRKYTTVSAGYGARFIKRESLTLDAEIGPGYFWGDKVEDEDNDIIVKEEGFMVRTAAELKWAFTDNATFNQKLGAEVAEDNTRYVSDTSLSTKISDRMQMKVGYTVNHDTDVADDKEGTDTTTYINLVYNF
jgi:putative salt-induced outer membrane protein YdiY